MSGRYPLRKGKTESMEMREEQAVEETKKDLAKRLASILYSQIVDFCVKNQQYLEPGELVLKIPHIEGIERVPPNSVLFLYDSRPELPPLRWK